MVVIPLPQMYAGPMLRRGNGKKEKGKGEQGRGLRMVWVGSDQVGSVFGSGRVVEHTGQAKDRERERERATVAYPSAKPGGGIYTIPSPRENILRYAEGG